MGLDSSWLHSPWPTTSSDPYIFGIWSYLPKYHQTEEMHMLIADLADNITSVLLGIRPICTLLRATIDTV